jgi:hypothetical protein
MAEMCPAVRQVRLACLVIQMAVGCCVVVQAFNHAAHWSARKHADSATYRLRAQSSPCCCLLMLQHQECPHGEGCLYSRNTFECWLHPYR